MAGTEFVNVSPVAGDIDAHLQPTWLAPIPGTDVALMLGIAYVLKRGLLLEIFAQSLRRLYKGKRLFIGNERRNGQPLIGHLQYAA